MKGKTVITLTAIEQLYRNGKISKVLIIAPLRVAKDTWPAEIKKWDHLKGMGYAVAVGTESDRKEAVLRNEPVTVINRENVDWLINKSGLPFDFDCLVIDELSSFKSHTSQRFKALMKVRPKVKRCIGLTGTPSSNGLMDLWAEYRLLDMGKRLGRFIGRYRTDYFKPDRYNGNIVYSYVPLPGAEEKIYEAISDITVSMKAADYLHMPECVYNRITVTMSPEERDKYRKLKKELILSLPGGEVTAANAASLSNKLTQMSNGAVYNDNGDIEVIHDRKLDALEDIIEAANGKPVLVAYWYRHDLERIKKRFTVSEIKTEGDIARWNAGKSPVACIHPASAGHGLNLQSGGSCLVWFGLTWSLELYQQTNARLYRQGQKNTVVIHHIITEGTIDERIIKALADKDTTQNNLLEAVKKEIS